MAKAFALLSGGIDSTTALYVAMRDFAGQVEGVSVDYGQRHHKEIDYAKQTCHKLNIDHHVIDLSSVVPKTMLTDAEDKIPEVSYAEIPKGVSPTYVPFRNGLMLSAIASFGAGQYQAEIDRLDAGDTYDRDDIGEVVGEWGIYFGAHAEDAHNWAYPDCTFEFAGAMGNAIFIGTYYHFRLHVPLIFMVKKEIIRMGAELGVNFADTWSCYVGGETHCGVCPTCRSRREGFIDAGVPDPTVYAK